MQAWDTPADQSVLLRFESCTAHGGAASQLRLSLSKQGHAAEAQAQAALQGDA